MSDRVKDFTAFRQRMNTRILEHDNQVVRRFFALDKHGERISTGVKSSSQHHDIFRHVS